MVSETFFFGENVYDVDHAMLILTGRKPAGEIAISTVAHMLGLMRINEAHARTRDLRQPLICVPFQNTLLPIDGWHRIWRADREEVPTLPYQLLTRKEADSCLLEGNKGFHNPTYKKTSRTRRF